MTYDLFIGDRSFSSWSLRGWLMFEKFNIPVKTTLAGLYSGTLQQDLAPLAPARFVPTMRLPDGTVVGDTLAMAETLHERHPEAQMWPADPAARALARWMVAEMHSGFTALRSDCPMQLLGVITDYTITQEVRADLTRLETLWDLAREKYGAAGPWLFGTYSLADVFFAPVAARIAGFALPVSDASQHYVAQHLSDPAFRRWRAMGLTTTYDPIPYIEGRPLAPWPGPKARTATPSAGPSRNEKCPYSGKPTTHYLSLDDEIWGFCNQTCRDKTMNDPDVWPAFVEMIYAR